MKGVDTTHLSFIERLRDRSDRMSWVEFHERYGELLYRYARRRGATHGEAEDIVQEVELYLFKALDGFRYDQRKGRFRGYLRSSVVHAMGRHASREAPREATVDPRTIEALGDGNNGNDPSWEREWQLHRLRWAMRSISTEFEPATLEAFRLHVLAGRSVEETAAQLGMNKASVYQAKSRVLRRLRTQICALDSDVDV